MPLPRIHTKRRFAYGLALFFVPFFIKAQQAYFQQEVNYTMQVRLNDEQNELHAKTRIQYINNAPIALSYLYFHLWPNAYKNNNSALAKQLLSEGKKDFYYASAEERGFIDSLNFTVNGKAVKWAYDSIYQDVCKLILNEPLRSLDTLVISTPFFVKIPDAKFSRLGHTGQAYFITQWFPKPAVFDNNGWHPMPYLDQGEFYSEFGSFDVSITLPQNYLLAATGDRVDAEEEENFLNNKVVETLKKMENPAYSADDMRFPPSSKQFKTVRFVQHRVHDFAWFADKRFNVVHDQVELPTSKRTVDTWVFFTNERFNLWRDAITYVNESTLFYSHLNGDYPYNHVTAVDGTIMAGGGMEYPNITVIGSMANKFDLDVTIAHEVGHNWFYGVLGSNERDYPFMDEGLNSFYEMRYMRAKYPDVKLSHYLGGNPRFNIFRLGKYPVWRQNEALYTLALKSRTDQALNLPSQDFTSINYGAVVYSKTPVLLDYLMEYMGEDNFDKAMKFYFEQFKFRHPAPNDLFKTLSFFSGLNLEAFEKHLVNSTHHIDYQLKQAKHNKEGGFTLTVKNKSNAAMPFNVYGYRKGKPVGVMWFDGFEKTKTINFAEGDIDYFKIDGNDKLPDINRRNNSMRASGLFKKMKPFELNFVTALNNPEKNQLNVLPIAGLNVYNGPEIGLALHNYGIYRRRLEYMVAPVFGSINKRPAGFAQVDLNLFPKRIFQQISLGAKVKSFTYDYFNASTLNTLNGTNFGNLQLNYFKVSPFVEMEFKKKKPTSLVRQQLTLISNLLITDSLNTSAPVVSQIASVGPVKKTSTSLVNQAIYQLNNKHTLHPFSFLFSVQQANSMSKVFASLNYHLSVSKKNHAEIRVFAGSFVSGTKAERAYYGFRPSGYSGSQDYLFEGNYLGRNEYNGLSYNQFLEKDGNMKVLAFTGNSDWMASANIKSPRLFILPVRIFADVMFCDGSAIKQEVALWDAGLNITLWKDMIEVYIPVTYSEYIKQRLELNNVDFYRRIRFTFNIHKLVPKNFVQNAFLQ